MRCVWSPKKDWEWKHNKILLLVARYITTQNQPRDQHNLKSSQILINVLLSDFRVISADVLVLWHLGCSSKVSYKKTKAEPSGSIHLFCKILVFAGTVLPPCAATSEKVEQNYSQKQ